MKSQQQLFSELLGGKEAILTIVRLRFGCFEPSMNQVSRQATIHSVALICLNLERFTLNIYFIFSFLIEIAIEDKEIKSFEVNTEMANLVKSHNQSRLALRSVFSKKGTASNHETLVDSQLNR